MDRKAWIVVTLCIIGIGVNAWFTSQNQAPRAAAASKPAEASAPAAAASPAAPAAVPSTPAAAAGTPAASITAAPAQAEVPEETHTLTKGSATYHFTNRGAGIAKVILAAADQVTLNEVGKEAIGALRREVAGRDPVPYKIVEKTDKTVVFEGKNAEGILIRKAYSLTEGEKSDEHLLALTVTLTNTGAAPYRSEEYYLYAGAANSMRPDEISHPRFFWNDHGDTGYKDTSYFSAGLFKNEKAEFNEHYAHLQYAGVMSRFYLTLISHVKPEGQPGDPGRLWATRLQVDHHTDKFKDNKSAGSDYATQASMGLPPVELAPGATQTEKYEIYTGPKEYHRLAAIGNQREDAMFYGWSSPISRILTKVMRWLHSLTSNWGISIVLMTLLIRTVIWPIHAKSQYTMKRMALLGPKMKELQEKYKDEPQKAQVETMKLYKDYGVNPLGGCLPMLLQIPIFFGFYSVLQNAAELRGQPFLGWVHDLSLPDTVGQFMGFDINPLPMIMGVTMILQMKLTPQPQTQDKAQKFMFTVMPFFFLYICYNFAAALALYWSTQNLFSIFQSWIMKLYMKDPELVKVDRSAPSAASSTVSGGDAKKAKNRPPKLGG